MAASHYLAVALYVLGSLVILTRSYSYETKQRQFALFNVVSVFVFFFYSRLLVVEPPRYKEFGILVILMLSHWILINAYNKGENSSDRLYWFALISPIVLLIVVRGSGLTIVGISYLAFRMSQAAFEMGGRPDMRSSLSEYVSFVVFPPTFFAGPINPLQNYQQTADAAAYPSGISLSVCFELRLDSSRSNFSRHCRCS